MRRRNAFTLVELVIVVIVLGLLLAVALPTFFGTSNSARNSAAKQYLSIAYREMKAQQTRNDGVLPTVASLVVQAASDEPELSFSAAPASSATSAGGAKLIYVEVVGGGVRLGNVSGTGALCTLVADQTTGFVPLVICVGDSSFGGGAAIALPVNSSPPLLSGSAQVGQIMSASNGAWTNSPTSYSYAWQRCDSGGGNCTAIVGATSPTYTLTNADIGATLRAAVTATNGGGNSGPSSSAASAAVQPLAPVNTAAPTLSGVFAGGQTISVSSNGAWTNSPTSYSYLWQLCDGAGNNCTSQGTGSTVLIPVATWDASRLRVQVTASNGVSSAPASSSLSGPILYENAVYTTAGLQDYWKLDSSNGVNSAPGHIGNGYDLSLNGGGWGTGGSPLTGYATSWGASNNQQAQANEVLDGTGTWSSWVYLTQTDINNNATISWNVSSNQGWALFMMNGNGGLYWQRDNGNRSVYYEDNTRLAAGTWYQITWTMSNCGNFALYINGSQVGMDHVEGYGCIGDLTTVPTRLGTNGSGSDVMYFSNAIWFNQQLSGSDVARLWNAR